MGSGHNGWHSTIVRPTRRQRFLVGRSPSSPAVHRKSATVWRGAGRVNLHSAAAPTSVISFLREIPAKKKVKRERSGRIYSQISQKCILK